VEALVSFAATLVSFRLAGALARRWRASRRPELAAWAASLLAYALAAAALWGAATVLGRFALHGVPFATLTALRFVTGMPALAIALFVIGGTQAFAQYDGADLPLYLGIALVPGLIPMLLYYRGLASTPASLATLAELAFPATALVVNAIAFGTVPTGSQLLGAGLLAATVAALGLADRRGQTGVWIKISAPRMSRA
jgi:drug/metabolite transporter (DMT)-like permease